MAKKPNEDIFVGTTGVSTYGLVVSRGRRGPARGGPPTIVGTAGVPTYG
jgi:hypothetical protein